MSAINLYCCPICGDVWRRHRIPTLEIGEPSNYPCVVPAYNGKGGEHAAATPYVVDIVPADTLLSSLSDATLAHYHTLAKLFAARNSGE